MELRTCLTGFDESEREYLSLLGFGVNLQPETASEQRLHHQTHLVFCWISLLRALQCREIDMDHAEAPAIAFLPYRHRSRLPRAGRRSDRLIACAFPGGAAAVANLPFAEMFK